MVEHSRNAPARYSCGHQDRLADLKASEIQPFLETEELAVVDDALLRTGRELRRQFKDGPEDDGWPFPITDVN